MTQLITVQTARVNLLQVFDLDATQYFLPETSSFRSVEDAAQGTYKQETERFLRDITAQYHGLRAVLSPQANESFPASVQQEAADLLHQVEIAYKVLTDRRNLDVVFEPHQKSYSFLLAWYVQELRETPAEWRSPALCRKLTIYFEKRSLVEEVHRAASKSDDSPQPAQPAHAESINPQSHDSLVEELQSALHHQALQTERNGGYLQGLIDSQEVRYMFHHALETSLRKGRGQEVSIQFLQDSFLRQRKEINRIREEEQQVRTQLDA
ncbi:MAG: hypothetical protein AABX37_01965, partial [Nanoarchaeota archaeon]